MAPLPAVQPTVPGRDRTQNTGPDPPAANATPTFPHHWPSQRRAVGRVTPPLEPPPLPPRVLTSHLQHRHWSSRATSTAMGPHKSPPPPPRVPRASTATGPYEPPPPPPRVLTSHLLHRHGSLEPPPPPSRVPRATSSAACTGPSSRPAAGKSPAGAVPDRSARTGAGFVRPASRGTRSGPGTGAAVPGTLGAGRGAR